MMQPPPHMNMSMPPPSKKMFEFFLKKITLKNSCHIDAMMPPNMMNVPQMVPPPQHNLVNPMIGPPGMPPGMPGHLPPPVINPSIPPNRSNDDHRNNQPMDKRNDSAPPAWRSRDNRDTRDTRDKERDYRERDRGKPKK